MSLENIISAKVTLFALPVFFIAILIEITAKKLLNARGTLNSTDDSVSIFMGLMSVVTNGAAAFITLGMLLWAEQ